MTSHTEPREFDSDTENMLPAAALTEDVTPTGTNTGAVTPSEVGEGMLPRDVQLKTAYYDYAAEKQLSQADAKLFYQRSQLEAQKTGGSASVSARDWNAENSEGGMGSPMLSARERESVVEREQRGNGSAISLRFVIFLLCGVGSLN